MLTGIPPRRLRERAHRIAARLRDGDLDDLPSGIAILAMLDGGCWFDGVHYHAMCPRDGMKGGKFCRRRGLV
jgi:hypothetical protein